MFLSACLPRACFVSLNINLLLLLLLLMYMSCSWKCKTGESPAVLKFSLSFWDMPSELAEHHEEYPFSENKNHNFVHQKQKLKNMNPFEEL